MRKRSPWLTCLIATGAAVLCVGLGLTLTSLPPIQDRLGWRLSEARALVWYALFPPQESVFTPNPTLAAMVRETLTAIAPTPSASATAQPSAMPTPTPSPTPTRAPLPTAVVLEGVRHEYQKWNNCGPATLSMALSFWGWDGDQRPVAAYTKPNPRDKNVMPYELADFVDTQTDLKALVRPGGDLERLKSLIAAGFPVMVEKGFEGPGFPGWMGHYEVLTGYDDARQRFIAQDSYISSNLPVPYDELASNWRAFNYIYLVVYPPEREGEVLAILGSDSDEKAAYTAAAQRASDEIYQTTGRDQMFAWFNRGTNLVELQDYGGAAAAYDEAFRINAELAVSDPDHLPWRLLWYQTGPYKAYYYTQRYNDVISLATATLNIPEPVLEESYYWRGLAREAQGDVAGAIEDLQKALEVHPDFTPAVEQLARLGVNA